MVFKTGLCESKVLEEFYESYANPFRILQTVKIFIRFIRPTNKITISSSMLFGLKAFNLEDLRGFARFRSSMDFGYTQLSVVPRLIYFDWINAIHTAFLLTVAPPLIVAPLFFWNLETCYVMNQFLFSSVKE